ncbi:hypothetical protein ACFL0F_00555 [Patescibacteria group bacterium]
MTTARIVTKVILVVVAVLVGVWLLLLFWFTLLRYSPLSYYARNNLKHLKHNDIFNRVYQNYVVYPLVKILPNNESILVMPVYKGIQLLQHKNLDGDYKYESYGMIEEVKGEGEVYKVTIKTDSGKYVFADFDPLKSRFYMSNPSRDRSFYILSKESFEEDKAYDQIGNRVRIRWWTKNSVNDLKSSSSNGEGNIVDVIQRAPDWLKYE